jgi:two-component system, LytTR family, sensor kinase
VTVDCRVLNGQLSLSVCDDGPGFPADLKSLREGIGLSNTRERLQRIYGSKALFELSNLPSGGARVHILMPLKP